MSTESIALQEFNRTLQRFNDSLEKLMQQLQEADLHYQQAEATALQIEQQLQKVLDNSGSNGNIGAAKESNVQVQRFRES